VENGKATATGLTPADGGTRRFARKPQRGFCPGAVTAHEVGPPVAVWYPACAAVYGHRIHEEGGPRQRSEWNGSAQSGGSIQHIIRRRYPIRGEAGGISGRKAWPALYLRNLSSSGGETRKPRPVTPKLPAVLSNQRPAESAHPCTIGAGWPKPPQKKVGASAFRPRSRESCSRPVSG